MNTQTTKNDVFQIITEQLLDLIKTSNLPAWKPGYLQLHQQNALTGSRYHGVNVFLLTLTAYVNKFNSNKWITFNQIRQLGGKVKKGSKGTKIVYYFVANQAEIEKRAQEKLINPQLPDIEKVFKPKLHVVFNLDQTENLDIDASNNSLQFNAMSDIDAIISNHPNLPEIIHFVNRNPAYSPIEDCVYMPLTSQYPTADNYYVDLFHELGHATGHQSRLSRKAIVEVAVHDKEQYSEEELVAEFTACFCADHFSLKPDFQMSATYLKGWFSYLDNNPTVLVKSIQAAQKAAKYILQLE